MTRHQLETELYDIRREITRLQRRQAQLLTRPDENAETLMRPGWPMRRVSAGLFTPAQASGAMISTSEPSRIAV